MVPKEPLLDGLDKKVEDGFKRVNDRFDQLDKKIDDGFARVDSDIRELRGDMSTLKYGLLSATVLILAALIAPAIF